MKRVLFVVVGAILAALTLAQTPTDPRIVLVKDLVMKALSIGRSEAILFEKEVDEITAQVIYDEKLPNESPNDRTDRVTRVRKFFQGFAKMERDKTERIGEPFYDISYVIASEVADKGNLLVRVSFTPHEPGDKSVKGYRFIVLFADKDLVGNQLKILTVNKTTIRPGLCPGFVV